VALSIQPGGPSIDSSSRAGGLGCAEREVNRKVEDTGYFLGTVIKIWVRVLPGRTVADKERDLERSEMTVFFLIQISMGFEF
jgi:hypothetical protein